MLKIRGILNTPRDVFKSLLSWAMNREKNTQGDRKGRLTSLSCGEIRIQRLEIRDPGETDDFLTEGVIEGSQEPRRTTCSFPR